MGRNGRERPSNHRADRSDRGALSDEDEFGGGRAIERERAEGAGEIQFIVETEIEQPRCAGAIGDAIEADFEGLAVFRV